MKPIDYMGYRFRSRLEARYAVFFTDMGEPWEYEREGFALVAGPYLPDFWLPRLGVWVEVKGEPIDGSELLEEFSAHTPLLLAEGLPTVGSGLRVFSWMDGGVGFGWHDVRWGVRNGRLCPHAFTADFYHYDRVAGLIGRPMDFIVHDGECRVLNDREVSLGRRARFEFGR